MTILVEARNDGAVRLVDIDQVVIQEQLTLCLLIEVTQSTGVLEELLFCAKQLGMSLDFKPVDRKGEGSDPGRIYVITAIGPALGAGELRAISSILAEHGAVNAQRKAELLDLIAQLEGVLVDQVIAVGDGANDALMLARAGLGIAFHAKPTLRARADTAISAAGLDAILYLLGMSAREISEIG